jgi:type IV pilus assembly protein PilM
VDIGARSTQLLFVTGGRFYLRTLTLWAQAITQAVADEQRIGPVAAEAAKREVFGGETGVAVDSPVRDAVERATANFNLRMGLEVARALAAHAQQPGAVRPAVVQLTGGGAQTPGLIAALRDKLGLTVDLLGLPPGVQLAATAKADGADKAGVYLPVLVGLAAGATRTEGRTPNLLPPEWSEAGALRRAQRWWLAGAALLLLALVPPLWEAAGRRHTAKQEADRLERAMQPLRAQAAANAQILAELERMHEEGARLGRLVRAKSVWLDFFAELQSALFAVEDVWLDRLQLEQLPPGNMMAGAPDAPLRLAISGRLLDTRNPLAKVSPEANVRVRRLLAKIRESRFVAAVEDERFDATQPGILRFDVTLLLEPAEPL